MSYDVVKKQMGHEPIYIMEIDLDFCSLDFGVAPCTASGAAGTECYNTFATCPVQGDYSAFGRSTKTYRFSSQRIDELQQAGDAPTIPSITSVSMAPTKLTPAQGLGVRSTVNIRLQDHPFNDVGTDPYFRTRTYTPEDQGTFWGKFVARNKFYENRPLRIKQGYLNEDGSFDASNLIEREYVIHKITGPDASGKVTIDAKDPLKFADAVKAQWPQPPVAVLDGAINSSVTSFSITDSDAQIFDGFNGGQEYIRIDDELMHMTNVVDNGGGSYTVTVDSRGSSLSQPIIYSLTVVPDEHDDDTNIQLCHYFSSARIDDICFFLLNTAAGIDSSFLPLSKWQDSLDFSGLTGYLLTALLVEPTAVKTYLSELTEYTIMLYWHEREQEVLMNSLLDKTSSNRPTFDDSSHIVKDSVNHTLDVTQRISQVWTYFGLRSPILQMDELKSFSNVEITADLSKESVDEYAKPAVKQIFSRWFPVNFRNIVLEINTNLLNNYKDTKDIMTIDLDPKDDDNWTGDRVFVDTQYLQESSGANKVQGYIILQVNEKLKPTGTEYTYLLQSEFGLGRYARITPNQDPDIPANPFPDYPAANDDLKERYAFIAPNSEIFPSDNTEAYQIR